MAEEQTQAQEEDARLQRRIVEGQLEKEGISVDEEEEII